MIVDLSKYLNKTITVELGDGTIKTGGVNKCSYGNYSYTFDHYIYTKDGIGYTQSNIVRIISVEQEFKGIAQKAPNINLEDFVGQTVMIKTRVNEYFVGKLNGGLYLGDLCAYDKDGNSYENGNLNIMEIYSEDAYTIQTKSTFDEPVDPKIEQAKQLLSQMSEEQVAKLLKSLK
jgi:small nuclear ribonucleoprotein (snRNP)-like protein